MITDDVQDIHSRSVIFYVLGLCCGSETTGHIHTFFMQHHLPIAAEESDEMTIQPVGRQAAASVSS